MVSDQFLYEMIRSELVEIVGSGVGVLEFGGIGPGPFCAMLLCDLGAEVVRIDRAGFEPAYEQFAHRGRLSVALDLKKPAAVEACLQLAARSDLLFEGFRPGVMDRLGLGPDVALARNPKLVYGRMTGWGQDGPYANAAGHDINYISLSGALHAIGLKERPAVPLNLIGDSGGGAMFLVVGLLAALLQAGGASSSGGGSLFGGPSTVKVESKGMQRVYKRMSTKGGVRLVKQLSREACVEGVSWGFDRDGIWVDKGCRAEFAVGR